MKKLTFKQRLGIIVAFIALLFVAIPVVKASGPFLVQKGDYVVVDAGVDLKNFNDSSTSVFYKPVTCHPLDGEIFEVTSVTGSLLGLESTARNCEGGVSKLDVQLH